MSTIVHFAHHLGARAFAESRDPPRVVQRRRADTASETDTVRLYAMSSWTRWAKRCHVTSAVL